MKSYYRVMLGRKSVHHDVCFNGNFLGVDFGFTQNFANHLPDNWREFNKEFIPVYLETRPEKTKIAAGLACGTVWRVCKGFETGDIVLCPDGEGAYSVGEVSSEYYHCPDEILPHRRKVNWYQEKILRDLLAAHAD